MQHTLLFALLLLSFFAQGQQNPSQTLLDDPNIVWAARSVAIINANNHRDFSDSAVSGYYLNLLKYQSATPPFKTDFIKEDFAFLLSKEAWEGQPNRYFSNKTLTKAANFKQHGAIYLPSDHQETSFYTNADGMPFVPIRQADIALYQFGILVYFDQKNNRFGCLIEYVAPVLNSTAMQDIAATELEPAFYYRLDDRQLKANAWLGDKKNLRGYAAKFPYYHDEKEEVKSKVSFEQATALYINNLRKDPNARRRMNFFNTKNEADFSKPENSYKIGKIDFLMSFYYQNNGRLTYYCPEIGLSRFDSNELVPDLFFQHKF